MLLITFNIFHESGVKIFLLWFINKRDDFRQDKYGLVFVNSTNPYLFTKKALFIEGGIGGLPFRILYQYEIFQLF